MTSKKPASSKRAAPPRACDYTKAFLKDWERLSAGWRAELDERIHRLQQLRDDFAGCIGCGCLSMKACRLLNPDDALAATGAGPRRLEGLPLD